MEKVFQEDYHVMVAPYQSLSPLGGPPLTEKKRRKKRKHLTGVCMQRACDFDRFIGKATFV